MRRAEPQRAPHAPAPRSRSARWRPTRSSGSRSTRCAPPRSACSRRRRPPIVDTDHVAPVRAASRDAVETVLRLLPESEPMSFRALASGAPDRLEVIVRFLAVLELYKQGVVDLDAVHRTSATSSCAGSRPARSALDVASLDDWDDAAGRDDAPLAEESLA